MTTPTLLAIDIGGTKVAAALVHDDKIIDQRKGIMPAQETPSDLQDLLKSLCQHWLAEVDLIAVATTGFYRDGHVYCVNHDIINYWHGFPLLKTLTDLFDKPIYIVNDALAATWGEYRFRDNHSVALDSYLYLTVSTGVGGGIVANQKLMTSASGLAGHVGHTVIQQRPNLIDQSQPDYSCGCGRWGCVEAIASGTAISRHASTILGKTLSTKDAFVMAKEDKNVQAIITAAAEAIATLIANIKATTDIEQVSIGGSVGLAEGFIEQINQALSLQPKLFQVPVLPAKLGANSGILGVADWATKTHKAATDSTTQNRHSQ